MITAPSKMRLAAALAGAAVAWAPAAPAFGAPPPAAAPPPVAAAPTTASEAHFQRGLELHQEQDFAGALVEFRRSYELAPTYKMLYNVGQVCYQLNDYACALRSFEAYLREGAANVSTERRAEVEREVRKLQTRVGRVEIVANLPGVEVSVDDVAVGTTPLREYVIVSTGRRRVTGAREGFAPVSRFVEVAGGDSTRVQLTFAKAAPTGAPVGEPARESRWNALSWAGLGTSAAFAGAAAVTGVVALKASNDLKDGRYAAEVGPSDRLLADRDRAKHFSLASDVLLGLSVATLAATFVYTFTHTPSALERAPENAASAKLGARVSAGGVFVFGAF